MEYIFCLKKIVVFFSKIDCPFIGKKFKLNFNVQTVSPVVENVWKKCFQCQDSPLLHYAPNDRGICMGSICIFLYFMTFSAEVRTQ